MAGSVNYISKRGLLLDNTEVLAALADTTAGTVVTDTDLSSTQHDLTGVGTVTKSPVATGSEVMGYSGFSVSDELQQSYESELDFGTGDFAIKIWINNTASSSATLFNRAVTKGGILIRTSPNGGIETWLSSNTSLTFIFTWPAGSIVYGTSQMITLTRESGTLKGYLDDALVVSTPHTANLTFVNAFSNIGNRIDVNEPFNGSLSLLKIHKSALTNLKVKQIYDSEKDMFKPNSVFTQVGLSYSIDLALNKVDRSSKSQVKTAISLGGNQETISHRQDIFFDINERNVLKSELPKFRSFLDSVQAGEPFTFDPYGTIASPDYPITVIADPNYTEKRTDTLELFDISLKVRQV